MDLPLTSDLYWHHRSPKAPEDLQDGAVLSDGRELVVVSHHDTHLVGTEVRVRAQHAWLHAKVVILDRPGALVPCAVVPVDHLSDAVITEAVRRWLRREVA